MSIVERPSKLTLREAWDISNGLEVNGSFALTQKAASEKRFNEPVQVYLERILKSRHSPILDVGSNPFYDTYIPKGFDVVTLDWSVQGLPFSGRRVVGDVEQIPFLDNSFPVVLSKQVYGYLLNPDRLVAEMVRVTEKGGLFLLIDMEGDMAQHERLVNPNVSRLCDFYPLKVEVQARTLGLVDTRIEQIQFWPGKEIAPGIKTDITLSCLMGIKQ
jgi:SAM-dependent methyltransferase